MTELHPLTSATVLARRATRPWWMLGGHAGLIAVMLVLVVVTTFGSDAFLTANNLVNVLRQVSVIAVIAAGLTVLMIAGGIDFSMGSNAVVTMALVAQLIAGGADTGMAIIVGLVAASAIGLVNGLVITFTSVAPFVATLATATLLDGLALFILNGMSVSAGEALYTFGNGAVLGVPYLLIAAAAVCVVLGLTLRYTSFGRNAFAIGGNEDVARLSGIAVARTKVLLYTLMGALAGLAGVMMLARLAAASPGVAGLTIELQAVAAVVIGGTALAGGKGTMIGTALGVLLLGIVANALNLLGVSSYLQQMAVGTVLLIAAVANAWQRRR
ncbi:ABC transporter permease [Microbacterium sp. zg-YB36]|uniref:ABC transporter permease n=1 Tax=Microbacterium sp. zg-YB36 TaxID=2969407 RepID=UPI00214B9F39|nr:ABC transporter permease [Microbacterium sp. zg-YB36]MDL5351757.1 ABC transporter permease [Microbacterium sp. zg-YB36]